METEADVWGRDVTRHRKDGRACTRARAAGRTVGGACALVLAAATAGAEPPPLQSRENPKYTADLLVFHEEGREEALVWIVVHCPATSIFFEPKADSAELRVAWKVHRGKRQIDGDVLVRRVAVREPRRDEAAVLQTIPVRLTPGTYDIDVELSQPGAEVGAVVTRELTIDAVDRSAFAVSSVFLSAEPPGRLGTAEPGLPSFPIVPRIVSDEVQHVSLVGELYAPGGCKERYRVTYRLVDDDDRLVQQRSEEIPCEGFRTALVLPLDTTKLVFGDYRVELTAEAPNTRDKVYRELWFSADETLLPLRANFKRTLEVIEAIATDEELTSLRDAPPGEREAAWESFWASRDPDAESGRNEFKEEFFERIRYANQHFGTTTLRGWKTDRGYTLLKYGHPDRVQSGSRSPFGSDVRASETWEYLDAGLTFVFVDDVGLGDFRLVQGTTG
jgi:GWxTD domain-containing protein